MARSRAAMSAALTGGFTAAAAAALAKMEPTTLPHIDTLKLLQVQSTFRHGARTPMEDMGERPVEWTAAEQRAYTRPAGPQQYCAVSLLHAGSTQPVDALAHFCGGHSWRDSWMSSSSSLNGGGVPGILTNVGLAQANALGASLRSRYVDPAAQGEADVGRARLLPASWEAARGLVAARSTLVERTVFTVSGLALSLTPNPNPNPHPNPQPHPNPHPHQASGVLAGLYPTEAAAGTMEAEVALNVPRGAGDAEEFMVINVQRCPRLKALFRQGGAERTR